MIKIKKGSLKSFLNAGFVKHSLYNTGENYGDLDGREEAVEKPKNL